MVRNGVLELVMVATLALGSAAATAQDQMKDQEDKDAQSSGMMMQGKSDKMGMHKKGMGSGMMGGMDSMMGMGSGMGPCSMMEGMGSMKGMKGADLTDEQQAQLAELQGEQAKQQFMLMQRMQEPRQNFQELMSADQIDIDAIGQAYDELSDVRKEALMTHLKTKQKMQEIMEK